MWLESDQCGVERLGIRKRITHSDLHVQQGLDPSTIKIIYAGEV